MIECFGKLFKIFLLVVLSIFIFVCCGRVGVVVMKLLTLIVISLMCWVVCVLIRGVRFFFIAINLIKYFFRFLGLRSIICVDLRGVILYFCFNLCY